MKRAVILAAVTAVGSLTFVSAAQAELRVGKNFRMSSDLTAFRGKDQLGLAVNPNPNNANHIVAVHANYLSEKCEGTRSLDGGNTWSPADPFENPAPAQGQQPFEPSCNVSDHLGEQMFQTVAFGTGNNVYATYITPRGTLAGGEEAASTFVIKSIDGGATWGTGVLAMAGGASQSTGPRYELPTVAVDPGAGPGNADRVYVVAHERTAAGGTGGDVATAVSNDGGGSFSGVVNADPAGEDAGTSWGDTSQPAVAPDGSVYVAWRVVGASGTVRVARSTNGGQTWGTPVTATNVTAGGNTGGPSPPQPNPPAPLQSSGSTWPRLAVDQSNGNVYLVYGQGPPGPTPPPGGYQGADHFMHHDIDVYFQRSLNAGVAWSEPKRINDVTPHPGTESPGFGRVTQTRHPNVTVAPNGRVDIVWQDRRHWYRGCIHTHVRCDEARLGDTYYSSSTNAGTAPAAQIAFSENRRISDRSHNNDVGYDYRFGTGWAFGPIQVPLGDNQLLVGWMDAREGNHDNDNQDIYLAKVNHNAAATVPQETIPRTNATDVSVRLSQHTYRGGGEGLLGGEFATRNGTRVVIVNENDVPAILAAGVLARANLSQVLLSPAGGLPANVKAEVARMQPAGAYVIGDPGSLSQQVVQDLEGAGVDASQIERLGTANDAETTRAIAEELDRRTSAQQMSDAPAFNSAVIVNPASPDASAVAGLAAARRLPILFTDPDPAVDTLPAATTQALANLDIDDTLVVGGEQAVTAAEFGALAADSPQRLGGADQYATSQAVVAESLARGLPDNIAYVANGASPIDGALLGSTVGRVTGLLMLAPAPLGTNGPTAASQANLIDDLDRLILVQPAQGGGRTPTYYVPPGQGGSSAFAGCPSSSSNVISGTGGADTLTGTAAGDRIFAGTGNDRVSGLGGRDCVDLGPGADRGSGGSGADLILGRAGRDRIGGGSSGDRLRGHSGADRISGNSGNDSVTGGSSGDRISGGGGRDRVNGNSGRDRVSGGGGGDRVSGGSGGDRINGGSGRDRVSGNGGGDRLRGGSGRDRISGGSGNDRISARDGAVDRINCGSGRDRVSADASDIVASNCENVSVASASAAAAGSLGLPALVGGAYVALLGWRHRRSLGTDQ
jgi:Ca2+-binding RTX toxin-like protein